MTAPKPAGKKPSDTTSPELARDERIADALRALASRIQWHGDTAAEAAVFACADLLDPPDEPDDDK